MCRTSLALAVSQESRPKKKIPKICTTASTRPLQLVHTDVTGPFRIRSLGGAQYFLTFIDDYLQKTWIYFLLSKDMCFEKFRFFHRLVENNAQNRLKSLRSDNGRKFNFHRFTIYCLSHGIRRLLTQPHTSYHNGVAKRRNHSILDIVRCILHHVDMPSTLWAEAAKAACLLLNIFSTKS